MGHRLSCGPFERREKFFCKIIKLLNKTVDGLRFIG